jgi:hypothetical protein
MLDEREREEEEEKEKGKIKKMKNGYFGDFDNNQRKFLESYCLSRDKIVIL